VDGIEELKAAVERENSIQVGGTARSPEDAMELHRMGLQFAEIPITDPEPLSRRINEYQALMGQSGLTYLCHGPREGDPNNVDTLETVYLWLDPRFVNPDVIAYKVGFLKRLLKTSDALGITVCIENLSENAAHLSGVFETLPCLGLTLDLGHAQLLTVQNTGFGFMQKFPERVKHIHLHDNLGGTSVADDLHLPVGKGIIDFEGLFRNLRLIGYNRTITLELKPDEIRDNLKTVTQRLADAGFRV
jgi:sugar phosphate isomerase/epimerase